VRRLWIAFIAVAMVLVIALPATAKKPNKPKPPSAVPIAVSIDAGPMWVHEGDDLIIYTVTLENKTNIDYTDVAVKFTTTATGVYLDPVDEWESPADAVDGVVPANSSVWLRFYLFVHQLAEADDCEVGDECSLLATATVLIDEVPLTQTTMTTPLIPYPACGFEYDGVVQENEVLVPVEPYDVDLCIWTPPQTGVWKITLAPTRPDKQKGPINAVVAVRDGVPGNWCTLLDSDNTLVEDPETTFTRRWRSGDVLGWVYLPGTENGPDLNDGMCLHGGAGGGYFQVGNPASFYLRANGTVTTEWVGSTP
jgi:hypothetical protein